VNEITEADSVLGLFLGLPRDRGEQIGDKTMEIAQHSKFETAQGEVRSHDMTILLGYAAFAIVLLIAIYLGSMSSGTAPGDFATMIVFP
jgi:hypothetical protein